jgi:hypothetical protein
MREEIRKIFELSYIIMRYVSHIALVLFWISSTTCDLLLGIQRLISRLQITRSSDSSSSHCVQL